MRYRPKNNRRVYLRPEKAGISQPYIIRRDYLYKIGINIVSLPRWKQEYIISPELFEIFLKESRQNGN